MRFIYEVIAIVEPRPYLLARLRFCFLYIPGMIMAFGSLHAEVHPIGLFSDHMVLQRDVSVPVWGTAAPSEKVEVAFAAQTKATMADAQGRWRLQLAPMPASARGRTLTIRGADGHPPKEITDVLVGEVWLCAGDSSFGMPMEKSAQAQSDKPAATPGDVRFFRVAHQASGIPQSDVSGNWAVSGDPAIPSLFAKELAENLKVPVGIIVVADTLPLEIRRGHIRGQVQAATIEAFMSNRALQGEPAAAPILKYAHSNDELKEAIRAYAFAIGDWKLQYGHAMGEEQKALEQREPDTWFNYVEAQKKSGKNMPPSPPQKPTAESIMGSSTHISSLYNGMISPIAGYAVRGVAWSQGIGNATRATQYASLFPALIKDWRSAWGNPDLPFIYLQQWRALSAGIDPRVWAELREAQSQAQSLPKVAMVPTVDLPVKDSVWPADSATIARRLAHAAEAVAYGEKVAWQSPRLESVQFLEGKAIVQVLPHGCKLGASSGATVTGFALAERPNRWVYADATINGDKIVVGYSKMKSPLAVRFDWVLENQRGNIVDENGLPLEPFRTDKWSTLTETDEFSIPNVWAETRTADLYPVEDSSLPRVVIMGDSIMIGYAPYVAAALKGKANVIPLVTAHPPGFVAQSAISVWHLDQGDFAVIHYNDGLHSMPPIETDVQFEEGLRAALGTLKKISPRVIWATITPAPDRNNTLGPDSWNPRVLARNELSKKVAAEAGVEVDDLYQLIIGRREELQNPGDLHYKPEGYQLLGKQVADQILAELNAAQSSSK